MGTIRVFIDKHRVVAVVLTLVAAVFVMQLFITIALDITVRNVLVTAGKGAYRISKAWVTFSWWGGVRIGRLSIAPQAHPSQKMFVADEIILAPDYAGFFSSRDVRRAFASVTFKRPRVLLPLQPIAGSSVAFESVVSNALFAATLFEGRSIIVDNAGVYYPLPDGAGNKTVALLDNIDAVLEAASGEFCATINTRVGPLRVNIAATVDASLSSGDANVLVYDASGVLQKYAVRLDQRGGIVRGNITDRRDVAVGALLWNSANGYHDISFSHDRLRPALVGKIIGAVFPSFYGTNNTGVLKNIRGEVDALTALAVEARLRRDAGAIERFIAVRAFGPGSEARLRVNIDVGGVTANTLLRYRSGSVSLDARFPFASGMLPERVSLISYAMPLGASRLTGQVIARSIGNGPADIRYRIGVYDLRFGNYYSARAEFIAGYAAAERLFSFRSTHYGYRVDGSISYDTRSPRVADITLSQLPVSFFTAFSGGGFGGSSSVDLRYSAVREKGVVTHRLTSSVDEGFTGKKVAGIEAVMNDDRIDCRWLFIDTALGTLSFSGIVDGVFGDAVGLRGMLTTPAGSYPIVGGITGRTKRVIAIGSKDGTISMRGTVGIDGTRIVLRTGLLPVHPRMSAGIRLIFDTASTDGVLSGAISLRERTASPISMGASFRLLDQLILDAVNYEWGGLTLSGSGTAGMRDDALHIEAALTPPASNGSVIIDLDVNGERMNGDVRVDNISSAYFVHIPNVMGDIAARVEIGGTFSAPFFSLRKFSLLRTDIFGDRYDITCRGSVRNGEIALYDGVMKKTGARGYPVTDEQLIFLRRLLITPDITDVLIECRNFDYMSVFDGVFALRSERRGNGRYLTATTTDFLINKRPITPLACTMDDRGGVAAFSAVSHGIRGSVVKTGGRADVSLGYVYDGTEYASAKGFVQDGIAKVRVTSENITAAPLALLSHFLFVRLDGEAYPFEKLGKKYTVFVDASGPLSDLSLSGRFRSRGRVRLNLFQNEFRDSVLDIGFEGKRIVVNDCVFRDGAATIAVSGSASFARNMIDQLAFRITSSSNNMLTAAADLGFLKLDGPASFTLDLTESFLYPRITGAVVTRNSDITFFGGGNTLYRPRFGEFFINAAWNLGINAGNSVHFYNAFVGDSYIKDGSSMRVLGRAIDQTLALRGTIVAQHGTAYYLNNAYQLENLTVSFPEVRSFDPIIEGRGKTRKKLRIGAETLDVTLYLEVNGRFSEIMKNPMYAASMPVRFYTVPSVRDDYVRELVGLPAVREERMAGAPDELSRTIASILPADMIMRDTLRPLERGIRRYTGLDYFGIETGMFSRFSMSLITNSAAGVFDNPWMYLQDTRLSLGKFIPFNQFSRFLPELFLKYNLTITGNLSLWEHERVIQHEFAVELDLAQFSELANFIFEYTIDPSSVSNIEQKISVSTRWRF